MKLEQVTSTCHPMYRRALELYGAGFPLHEQRLPGPQARILADPDYHFSLIDRGDGFAGIILFWEAETFLYVEHFCIAPEMRNQGLGAQALRLLRQRGKPVILEIDPPEDEISVRRQGFYRRCGFAENPYPHVHPPYRPGYSGHRLAVMSCPAALSRAEYDAFYAYLTGRVMAEERRMM